MSSAAGLPPMPPGFATPTASVPVAPAPEPPAPVWTTPVPARSVSAAFVLGIIGISILSLVFLGVLAFVALSLGPLAFVVCGIAALIPLAVVVIVISFIDRWEPEPRGALWFGLLWGAAAAVAITLFVDAGIEVALSVASNGGYTMDDFVSSVIQAPVVEELTKGLGLLLVFLILRKNFDGPVDGLVYGATIAAGFAFTENILYFGSALLEDGGYGLGFTFFLRGVMSPFAHVMFTACTGVALGFASRRRGWLPALGFFVLGLAAAMFLHGLWNSASFIAPGLDGFLLIYAVVQVPLFVLAIIGVVFLRRSESRITRMRLEEYAAVGWFTPEEVDMLSTGQGRKRGRRWAGSQSAAARRAMISFIRNATTLAFTRNRMLIQRDTGASLVQEKRLLDAILADRAVLQASAPAA